MLLLFTVMFTAGRGAAQIQKNKTIGVWTIAGQTENWGLGFGAEGTQPTGNAAAEELKQYEAYYVGAKEEKVIYLTFDCG